jgi:general secretion pathway protein N
MRSKRGLIGVGLLTLVTGLLVMPPARVAYHMVASPDLAVSGLTGTAWSGTAREASIGGLYLSELQWSLHPLAIFTGRLSYTVSAKPISGSLDANVSMGFGRVITFSNLKGELPLDAFAEAIGVRGLQGDANFSFESVEITNGIASAADGTVEIDDLIVPIVDRNSLGGYTAEFFTQNNGVIASVEDSDGVIDRADGVIDLAGSLQIKADRSYAFVAQLIVKPQTPQGVRNQLKFLPPPDDRGQQEIRLEGVL